MGHEYMFFNNVSIIANQSITLGDRYRVGDIFLIIDSDFHGIKPWSHGELGICKPVIIGDNVLISAVALFSRASPLAITALWPLE